MGEYGEITFFCQKFEGRLVFNRKKDFSNEIREPQ